MSQGSRLPFCVGLTNANVQIEPGLLYFSTFSYLLFMRQSELVHGTSKVILTAGPGRLNQKDSYPQYAL